jgi:hypothetical protein
MTKFLPSYSAPAPAAAPAPPVPPFPIPTIRRHSYPLTLTDDNTFAASRSSTFPTNLPSARSKREPGGPQRQGGMIRRDMKEEVNGCRRHVIVFENPG